MRHLPMLILAPALLTLTACGDKADKTERREVKVDISADSDTGKLDIRLPGGIDAKLKLPGGMTDKTDFDIDGVGLYPGAKVGTMKVRAIARKGDDASHSATVAIGFTAPADAAAVADWYQQQFDAKNIAVTRTGETLTGKTRDGNDFTLALAPAASGSTGTLTIRDVG